MIKSNTAAHSTTVTKPSQSPVPVNNKRRPQHSSRQLTPRRSSYSALPVTWLAPPSVPMNKSPSNRYYRQLGIKIVKTVSCGGVFDLAVEQPQLFRKPPKNKNKTKLNPLATCPSESSVDTNCPSNVPITVLYNPRPSLRLHLPLCPGRKLTLTAHLPPTGPL